MDSESSPDAAAALPTASRRQRGRRKRKLGVSDFASNQRRQHPFSHKQSHGTNEGHDDDADKLLQTRDSIQDPFEDQLTPANAERVRKLVNRYAERLARSKRRIQRPPTPTESESDTAEEEPHAEHDEGEATSSSDKASQHQKQQERMKKKLALIFGDDPVGGGGASGPKKSFIGGTAGFSELYKTHHTLRLFGRTIFSVPTLRTTSVILRTATIAPHSYLYITWLAIVTVAFLYNSFMIPFRTFFHESSNESWWWLVCDYTCDFIYFIDLVCFRPFVQFVEGGILYQDRRSTVRHYVPSRLFIIDLISLLPLDLFYFALGGVVPVLRLPRLLKIHCYWECFSRIETAVSFPNLLRIVKTELYLIFMIHINAGIYYSISHWEVTVNHMSNKWLSYYYEAGSGQSAYVRCFLHSLKLAAKIPHNPAPLTTIQRTHQLCSHFFSIWLFAVLIGQIEDIYEGVTGRQDEFRHKLNKTLRFLKKIKMPSEAVRRVRAWFVYSWKFQKALDENEYLAFLPRKLQTDLAINVHFNTIAKVTLFHDVEQGLLRALVSSLRPRLYLPGEYICKKGQVGKEMFIIKYGLVEILGGPQNRTVFATLGEGTVIGEIALLSLAGSDNRRTADVRSKGVSQLFVLSKRDLEYHLQDYPAAEKILKKKAAAVMRQNVSRRKEAEEKFRQELEESIGIERNSLATAAASAAHTAEQQRAAAAEATAQRKKYSAFGGDDARGRNQFAKLVVQLLPQASALRQRLSAVNNNLDTKYNSNNISHKTSVMSTSGVSQSPSVAGSMRSFNFTAAQATQEEQRMAALLATKLQAASQPNRARQRLMRVLNAVRFVARTASASRRGSIASTPGSVPVEVRIARFSINNRVSPLATASTTAQQQL